MEAISLSSTYDAVIVGGGHNGLTAAAYLAKANLSVLVLERLESTGGAAVSVAAFDGCDAHLSRYSYLVSLMPKQIIEDLGLKIELVRRRYSSYTPVPGHLADCGLLIDKLDEDATRASFSRIGAQSDFESFNALYRDTTKVAQAIWPTVTEPLITRSQAKARLGDDALWQAVFEQPIRRFIETRLSHDLVRGVALTDAVIGTFEDTDDPLAENRCFLYHVIGGGTGDWDVPIGGMGHVSQQLADAAKRAGAVIMTGAEVSSVNVDGTVRFVVDGKENAVTGRRVLSNVAPHVLHGLMDNSAIINNGPRPEGSQVKINLLLSRLPKLRDKMVSPEAAFGGTFHINESYDQLSKAHQQALAGTIPNPLPCEVYCHSLSDASILGPQLVKSGAHTLTLFGLHVPNRLITSENNELQRTKLQRAAIDSLNSVLAEPIEDLLIVDAHGQPCIETKTTRDIELALNMPGGNIFHGPLSWPFLEDDYKPITPAERWGVETGYGERILMCGSGARRGGAVSGIGGHNAAMAVLDSISP